MYTDTGWRRLIGCLKLQVTFHKRATICRAILRKLTYDDKASCGSSPPCARSQTLSLARSLARSLALSLAFSRSVRGCDGSVRGLYAWYTRIHALSFHGRNASRYGVFFVYTILHTIFIYYHPYTQYYTRHVWIIHIQNYSYNWYSVYGEYKLTHALSQFVEAMAACAVYMNPSPYLSLAHKVLEFVKVTVLPGIEAAKVCVYMNLSP